METPRGTPHGTPPPATVLTPRAHVRTLTLVVLVVGLVLVPTTWQGGGAWRGPLTLAVALVTLVLPPWSLVANHGRRVVVHPDRVVVQRGERAVRTLRYEDLESVRPGIGWAGSTDVSDTWRRSLTLRGRTTTGDLRGLRVTTQTVETIDPLVAALAPVVADRPDLLPHDVHRQLFAEHLAELDREATP